MIYRDVDLMVLLNRFASSVASFPEGPDQWKLTRFQKLSIPTLNLPANWDCDHNE